MSCDSTEGAGAADSGMVDNKEALSRSILDTTDLIDNMTSFLEAGAVDVDKKILRNMALALTKHLNE